MPVAACVAPSDGSSGRSAPWASWSPSRSACWRWPSIPMDSLWGENANQTSFVLVFAIAVAVTSIPVISRIMHDLGLLRTGFARVVLGVAVVEDVILYVVLAVAVDLATPSGPATGLPGALGLEAGSTVRHPLPHVDHRRPARAAVRARAPGQPVDRLAPGREGAAEHHVAPADRAARLRGRLPGPGPRGVPRCLRRRASSSARRAAVPGHRTSSRSSAARPRTRSAGSRSRSSSPATSPSSGVNLNLAHGFEVGWFLVFLTGACLVKAASTYVGGRLAGLPDRPTRHLSVALNARGGPGIVLATVALGAGIVNEEFYIWLVLLAILTSVAAGIYLQRVSIDDLDLTIPGHDEPGDLAANVRVGRMITRADAPVWVKRRGRQVSRTFGRYTAGLRMTPDFLMCGGNRCGTTALHRALIAHPWSLPRCSTRASTTSTSTTPKGPAGTAATSRSVPSRSAAGQSERPPLAMEASGYYLDHPDAVHRIAGPAGRKGSRDAARPGRARALRPPARRRPRLRPVSFDEALDSSRAQAGERERMAVDPPTSAAADRHHSYLRRGQYVERLELFIEELGRDHVHVLFSERFSETPSRSTPASWSSSVCQLTSPRPGSAAGTPRPRRR